MSPAADRYPQPSFIDRAIERHHSVAHSFLPRGLSYTCAQVSADRGIEAGAAQGGRPYAREDCELKSKDLALCPEGTAKRRR